MPGHLKVDFSTPLPFLLLVPSVTSQRFFTNSKFDDALIMRVPRALLCTSRHAPASSILAL